MRYPNLRGVLCDLLMGLLFLRQSVDAFVPTKSIILSKRATLQPSSGQQSSGRLLQFREWRAKKDKDEEDKQQTGMNEAFRQLDSLDSLRDKKRESTVKLDDQSKATLKAKTAAEQVSLEEEVKLFKGLLQDSEQDSAELYSDVMKDMGGTPKDGTIFEEAKPTQIFIQETTVIPHSEEDTQKFLDLAIQEALEEARSMAPEGKKMSDSILDDEEIMKEIEEIFEKGNEKLLASLAEIREEQKAFAKVSAEQRMKVIMDNAKADQEQEDRLAQAEDSMRRQLGRVDKERAEVERAVADLQRAQSELNADPLLKLSSNIVKPAALAGVLLFSVRSVLDIVAMSGGGIESEAHLTAALIQGALALICAAYLLFF